MELGRGARSYRLGVVGPYSDIDAVIVAPQHATREAFFERFVPRLAKTPRVTECNPVPEAFTPVSGKIACGRCADKLS